MLLTIKHQHISGDLWLYRKTDMPINSQYKFTVNEMPALWHSVSLAYLLTFPIPYVRDVTFSQLTHSLEIMFTEVNKERYFPQCIYCSFVVMDCVILSCPVFKVVHYVCRARGKACFIKTHWPVSLCLGMSAY